MPLSKRAECLFSGYDFADKRGLEFGALNKPFLTDTPAKMFYADHLDTDALKAKYKGRPNVDPDNLVHVDFVINGEPLSELTRSAAPFDFIVASHVAEHVPDLAGWLIDLQSILKQGGRVALFVPDKRRCFDVLRPTSAPAHVVGAHLERRTRPTPATVYESKSLACLYRGKGMWLGNINPAELKPIHSLEQSLAMAQRASHSYFDCHVWTFTPRSLVAILTQLNELRLLNFAVETIKPHALGAGEIGLVLQKTDNAEQITRSLEEAYGIAERDPVPN